VVIGTNRRPASVTTEVENFPGFPEGSRVRTWWENMKKQAERFGAE